MEERIGKFCKRMGYLCNHLESSCHSLRQSVQRSPIPLDSASTTFVQCLNRRVSSTSNDLNLLESMSFGTVSFEELLGHCNEVYKKNQNDILELEDRLCNFGYVPEVEVHELEDILNDLQPSISLNLKTMEEDSLFEDSLNLQNLGLSDACLATIASDANSNFDIKGSYEAVNRMLEGTDEEEKHELEAFQDRKCVIHILKDDYESLPSYMKSLASWEDLLAAVEKMNSRLKEKIKGKNFIQQDEISSLGLGPKGRSYLLLLVKMNRLVVETTDGVMAKPKQRQPVKVASGQDMSEEDSWVIVKKQKVTIWIPPLPVTEEDRVVPEPEENQKLRKATTNQPQSIIEDSDSETEKSMPPITEKAIPKLPAPNLPRLDQSWTNKFKWTKTSAGLL